MTASASSAFVRRLAESTDPVLAYRASLLGAETPERPETPETPATAAEAARLW